MQGTKWYAPQGAREAVDTVEHSAAVLAFVSNSFCRGEAPGDTMPEDVEFGLYLVLSLVGDALVEAARHMGERSVN